MMARRLLAVCVVGVFALALAGCGDKPAVYKQGEYQGKPDGRPWDNAQFKGNKVEWEKAIKARNQGQDEYARTVAAAN